MATPVTLVVGDTSDVYDKPLSAQNPLPVGIAAGYPAGVTPLINASGNKANASAAATLTPSATTTAYLAGFEVSGAGSTAALPVVVTVTGILGGTLTYIYTFAAGVLVGNLPLVVEFDPPIPASAINTPIVVTCPAGGSGNTNNAAVAHGYQA